MLKLYNTLTRKKETFKPVKEGEVGMYVCGPTVYGPIHIGNARTFMTFDILYRYLNYSGFKVKYVQNITDVGHLTDVGEDKIMAGARKMNMGVFDFVDLMTKGFFEDLKSLNITRPDLTPRASEHIKDIIEVVKKLIENGYAYESNGFVYYDISKSDDYGKLSGQDPEQLKKQREREEHGSKRNTGDFTLWMPCQEDYPMKWKSPWGTGFPGWHIECSTMSSKYLGLPFDIHGGGKDLIFPHHEDEIAQAEGATGKKFVNYWVHSEFILVNGQKMSKSLGNVIHAGDAVKKYGAKAVRYFLLSSHYKTEINFTEETMESSRITVEKLLDFMDRLKEWKRKENNPKVKDLIEEAKKGFDKEMDDDLNVPGALASIFDLVRAVNKLMDEKNISSEDCKTVRDTMMKFDQVLGVLEKEKKELPDWARELIEKREKMRKEKKWERADQVRDELKEKGIVVEDTPQGPRYRYA